jgi:hypothetical protein
MTVRQPRYSKEEFAKRGDEIYESQVRSASATKVVRRLKQGIMAKLWRFALGQHCRLCLGNSK